MEDKNKTLKYTNSKRVNTKIRYLVVFSFALVFFSGIGARRAIAAALNFLPADTATSVGQTFSVGVSVSSLDKAMNAASGVILFPANRLEAVALSKEGSIINLWVQEPTLDNGAGSIKFEGIVFNPGFKGVSGKIFTIQFKARAAGAALLAFSSGTILANDGQGTNILSELGSARASVNVPVTGPAAPESSTPLSAGKSGTPLAVQVISHTHPDPNQWYAKKDAEFSWRVPPDTLEVGVRVDRYPASNPGARAYGVIASKEYNGLDDGVWFFHVRLRNAQGWGDISHFQFKIDTQPPAPFALAFPEGKENANPRPPIIFNTTDATSGLDYYLISAGDGDAVKIFPEEVVAGKPYFLPVLDAGKKTMVVQAFDKAGNVTTTTEEIFVQPLESPQIINYPKELSAGRVLIIKGTTYPNAQVAVRLTKETGETETHTVSGDAQGFFEIIWPRRPGSGLYALSAQVTDSRGAKSNFSEPLTFAARERVLLRIGAIAVNYLSVLVSLLALVVALFVIMVIAARWYTTFRKNLRKEVSEVEEAVHISFETMRADMLKQIQRLEIVRTKRELTNEEEVLACRLQKMLDTAEGLIEKEVHDVERQVKMPRDQRKSITDAGVKK